MLKKISVAGGAAIARMVKKLDLLESDHDCGPGYPGKAFQNGSNTTLHSPQLTCNVVLAAVRRVGTSPMDSARSSTFTLRECRCPMTTQAYGVHGLRRPALETSPCSGQRISTLNAGAIYGLLQLSPSCRGLGIHVVHAHGGTLRNRIADYSGHLFEQLGHTEGLFQKR